MDIITVVTFVILIFSAIIHEVAHGVVAEWLGDSTARDEGRITLNPIPHIDPIGTILLPLMLYLSQLGLPPDRRIFFGAAKPVPVNFNNLRNPKSGMALVSLAGPLSNFLLAAIAALAIRLGLDTGAFYAVLIMIVYINILLGTFNLIPIPPLDGSKVLASVLPDEFYYRIMALERWGFILILLFIYTGWFGNILFPVLDFFSRIFGLDL